MWTLRREEVGVALVNMLTAPYNIQLGIVFSLEKEQVNIEGFRHKFGELFSELFPFLLKNTG